MKFEFICECEHVDLSKLITSTPGSKTTFEIIDSNTVKVTVEKQEEMKWNVKLMKQGEQ